MAEHRFTGKYKKGIEVIEKNGKRESVQTKIPIYEPIGPYITGLFGCSCHPFNSWDECNKAHRQKFKIGDTVKNRHSEKVVTIEKDLGGGFYLPFEHAANYILIKPATGSGK